MACQRNSPPKKQPAYSRPSREESGNGIVRKVSVIFERRPVAIFSKNHVLSHSLEVLFDSDGTSAAVDYLIKKGLSIGDF